MKLTNQKLLVIERPYGIYIETEDGKRVCTLSDTDISPKAVAEAIDNGKLIVKALDQYHNILLNSDNRKTTESINEHS